MLFNITNAASVAAFASTLGGYFNITLPSDQQVSDVELMTRTNLANGVELRIFPLGDSITNGYQSTDNNGYRLPLQRDLAGSKILFVGSKTGGTMDDNWNEGWNGFTIDQIAQKAVLSQAYLRPNVILVHAGTNDLNPTPPIDPDHAPDRLGALIDQLIKYGADGTVILVAQIISARDQPDAQRTNALVQKYNDAIPGVVAQRASNHNVAVVDFRNSLQYSDYADTLHPNDNGYRKMADIWFKAIQDAANKGWIKAPEGPEPDLGAQGGASLGSTSVCLTPPIWVPAINSNGGPIATGAGHNGDMKWTASYGPHWSKAFEGINKNGSDVVFADLNGDGRADYLHVNRTTGAVILYLNTGSGDEVKFDKANDGKEIATGLAPRDLVRFADIDFDGKDDYIVIGNDTGSVTVWINGGPTPDGWSWNGPHDVAPGALAPGSTGADVLFADINGDGRPDYLCKNSKGGLDAYLNIGKAKTIAGIEWKPAGHIAQGTGWGDIALADINGDGRADYLTWSDKGGLTGYLNYRTEKEGQPGWAPTGDAGSVAGGVGRSSTWCRLADLNGDGKADYIVLGDKGEVEVYINKGTADTSVIGDGIRLADLNGDGFDDYLFLDANAAVHLYTNGGESSDGSRWLWVPFDNFNEIANGAGAKREQVLFADMDGDGKDDFVIVDPKTGGLTLYKSGGQQPDGKWGWIPVEGQIATGLGGPGSAIRLADMNGDGKADYIQLGENGEARLYINNGQQSDGTWGWAPYNDFKNIADGIGFTRDHVQFKDIDGDRKADYIGIDQMDGRTVVYKNNGPQPEGHWGWAPMDDGDAIASGIGSVGADVLWGRMEKTGRYSYLGIAPNTGALRAYLNGCNQVASTGGNSGSGSGSGGSTGSGTGTGSGGTGSGSGSSGSGSGSSGSGNGSGSSGSGSGSSGSGSGSSGSGSGSGSSGSSGSGNGSNNGNPSGIYIAGGLIIPPNGLGGLNLPTQGLPALTALTPYAISAQNALVTAQQAVDNLKSGHPTSAGVAAAEAAVQQAAQALNAVAAQASNIDTTGFDSATASDIQQQQAALQAAAQAVSNTVPRLQACESSPNDCSQVYNEVGNTLSSSPVNDPAAYFGSKGSGSQATGSGGSSGSGESGSGSSGGVAGCNPFSPLGGGLSFPSGGLGGLGLPTAGNAAITALRPFAIAARNAIGSASSLLSCLGGSPSSGALSAAEDALSNAASDVAALSSQLDAIELSSFTGDAVSSVQTQVSALRGASSALNGALSQLRTCIRSNKCLGIIGGVLAATAADEVLNPVNWFYGPGTNNPTQPQTTPPPSAVNNTNSDVPGPWLLNTKSGTSLAAFKAFILGLPDKGSGRQIVYDSLSTQWYETSMTLEEAKIVKGFPIVDQMVPNTPLGLVQDAQIETAKSNDAWHLQWLAVPRRLRIQGLRPFPVYHYEKSAGLGSWVYIFETKVDWTHTELQNVPHERYVVNSLRNQGSADPLDDTADIMDGYGHGTGMAASIAGNGVGIGVAQKASIVEVLYTRGVGFVVPPGTLPGNIAEAWAWAIDDVITKGRRGRAVFMYAAGVDYPGLLRNDPNRADPRYQRLKIQLPTYDDAFPPLLAEAWDNDIPTVISAGNNQSPQGARSPQRFGTIANAMITVGALQGDGNNWSDLLNREGTNQPGRAPDGSDRTLVGTISVSSIGVNCIQAVADGTHQTLGQNSGTSISGANVAGLLAYFMGLEAPYTLPGGNPGNIAFRAKQALIVTSRRFPFSPDALGQVNNNLEEITSCVPNPISIPPRSLDESSLNETAALIWAEIERRYAEAMKLRPEMYGVGNENGIEGLKEVF